MGETTIAWTQRTWNPVRGCSMAKGSETTECLNCYAARMAARGLPGMNSPTTGEPFAIMRPSGPRWTGKVELIPHMLDVPLKRRKPTTWFVNSMSDLFHESLPDADIDQVFAAMALTYQMWHDKSGNHREPLHTFQALTKRPERMRQYVTRVMASDWVRDWFSIPVVRAACRISQSCGHALPGNASIPVVQWFSDGMPGLWLGTSIGVRSTLHRIDDLRETPAAVRFLSLEPLLEDLGTLDLRGIHWVMVGGESGPGARPCDVRWIRNIVRQCREAKVSCFVKQLGAFPIVQPCRQHHYDFGEAIGRKARFSATDKMHPSTEAWRVHFEDSKGGDPAEWPKDLRVREMPEPTR